MIRTLEIATVALWAWMSGCNFGAGRYGLAAMGAAMSLLTLVFAAVDSP